MTAIRDDQGRPIGERLPDGSELRYRQPVEPGNTKWAPAWQSLFNRERRRSLEVDARRAVVKIRAGERYRNGRAGIATVAWSPSSNGVRHANVYLPKGSR